MPIAVASSVAFAQQPALARGPEMSLALEAAQTAISTCATNGIRASVSIVDSAGVLKVLLAADGTRKDQIDGGTKKAVTSNALKASTAEIAERMKSDPVLAAKVNAETNYFARPGGFPLMAGNEIIGAIGVSGAASLNGVAGGDRDAVCAKAGLEKIVSRLR
jgi:uncharacterized protein GlcG (DUF336 family)